MAEMQQRLEQEQNRAVAAEQSVETLKSEMCDLQHKLTEVGNNEFEERARSAEAMVLECKSNYRRLQTELQTELSSAKADADDSAAAVDRKHTAAQAALAQSSKNLRCP